MTGIMQELDPGSETVLLVHECFAATRGRSHLLPWNPVILWGYWLDLQLLQQHLALKTNSNGTFTVMRLLKLQSRCD